MLGQSDHRFGYLTSGPINLTRLAKKAIRKAKLFKQEFENKIYWCQVG